MKSSAIALDHGGHSLLYVSIESWTLLYSIPTRLQALWTSDFGIDLVQTPVRDKSPNLNLNGITK